MTSRTKNIALLAAAGFGAYQALRNLAAARNAYELRGKSVLITGGSRGLGLILAREFGRYGARVAVCARNEEELARAKADLENRGIECLAVPCDITDSEDANHMLAAVRDRFGRIDVLVNNAGIILVGPLELMTEQDFDDAMRTHFYGPLHLILSVIPEMKSRREGRIVNIASIGGKIASPHLAAYCASKFALVGLSESLRTELNKDGIRVTTVCPGIVRTGSHSQAKFKGQNEKEYTVYTLINAFPLASANAESAGRKIVRACRHGVADITLPRQYAAAAMAHGLAPGFTADVMSLADRILPGPGGRYEAPIPGKQSKTRLTESVLTSHLRKAERAHNEAA
jgi:NAD(P)-dependent dehydrogenase (short-subunit alcohol dehydrogenase family)